jgi:hypothetical protein
MTHIMVSTVRLVCQNSSLHALMQRSIGAPMRFAQCPGDHPCRPFWRTEQCAGDQAIVNMNTDCLKNVCKSTYVLGAIEGNQQPVGHELDVLRHKGGVHADQVHGQGLAHELLLDGHRLGHNLQNAILCKQTHVNLVSANEAFRAQNPSCRSKPLQPINKWPPQHGGLTGDLVLKHGVDEASEVSVQTLVAADELVGEAQARHQPTLLKPENRAERSGEEDALHSSKGDKTLAEGCILAHPPAGAEGAVRQGVAQVFRNTTVWVPSHTKTMSREWNGMAWRGGDQDSRPT